MIAPATLTPEQAKLIHAINDRVDQYPYKTDIELYGKPDFWQRIAVLGEGDCEDQALEKMFEMLNAGIPRGNLMLGTCLTEIGDRHSVLVVVLAPGVEVVLDQRQQRVVPIAQWCATPAEGGLGNVGLLIQVPGEYQWQPWRMEPVAK